MFKRKADINWPLILVGFIVAGFWLTVYKWAPPAFRGLVSLLGTS